MKPPNIAEMYDLILATKEMLDRRRPQKWYCRTDILSNDIYKASQTHIRNTLGRSKLNYTLQIYTDNARGLTAKLDKSLTACKERLNNSVSHIH